MSTYTMAKDLAEIIEYHRTTGWTIIRSKLAPVIFATKDSQRNPGCLSLKAWRGTARVPAWFYSFKSAEKMERYAAEYVQTVARSEASKASHLAEKKEKRANLKASNFWAVGDVAYTSWGYDQTNVDYFQIVELKARSVVVRQIKENCSDHGGPYGGKTAPRRNEFCGPPILCPLSVDGRFSAGPCWNKDKPAFRHNCYKWDGKAKYTSSNH